MSDLTIYLAPNGNKSNLTAEQWHIVRTPEFKAWFGGDWQALASAKINDSGMDEVTLANLSKDVSKVVDENGEPLVCYHGTSKKINKFNRKYSAQGVFWFTLDDDKIKRGESGASSAKVLIEVFINAKNIAGWDEYNKLGLGQIKERGFDAIKLDDDYVVFEPNQIKLADGSNKTFDNTNNDIRYEEGGAVEDTISLIQEDVLPVDINVDVEGEIKKFTEDEVELIQDENDNDEGGKDGGDKDGKPSDKNGKSKKKKGKDEDGAKKPDGDDDSGVDDEDKGDGKDDKQSDKKGKSKKKGQDDDDNGIIDIPYPPPSSDVPIPPQPPVPEPPQPQRPPNINPPSIDAVQVILDDLANLADVKFYLLPYMNSLVLNKVANDYNEIQNRCEVILWNRYAENILMAKKPMSFKDAESLSEFNSSFTDHCKYVQEITTFRNGYNYINFDAELEVLQGFTLNMIKSIFQTYINGGEVDIEALNTFMLYTKSIIPYFDKVKKYDDNYFRIITLTVFLNKEYLYADYLQIHLEFMKSVLGISTLAFNGDEIDGNSNVRNIIVSNGNTYVYHIIKPKKGLGYTTIDKMNLKSIGYVDEIQILIPILSFYRHAFDMLDIGTKKKFLETNKNMFNLQNEIYNSFLQTLQISLYKK